MLNNKGGVMVSHRELAELRTAVRNDNKLYRAVFEGGNMAVMQGIRPLHTSFDKLRMTPFFKIKPVGKV